MDSDNRQLGLIDRATRAAGIALSRRSLFKGTLAGVGGLAGFGLLQPLNVVEACGGCHYCVSGCVCDYECMTCYSAGTFTGLRCCSIGGSCNKVKDYICDNQCDRWCATTPC